MPKASKQKRNSAVSGSPYAGAPKAMGKNVTFQMKTDIGQHVLKNPGVAQAIVDKANLKQSDIVLEVGPGTGNLTVKILEKAKKVIAVELDPRMAAEVTKRVQGKPEAKRLEVLLGDVCKMDWPYFDVCISNTPYQISSPLTTRLLEHQPAPRTCVLTYQLEFAQRLLATPSSSLFSRLSLNTQMFANVAHVMKIGKNNFKPPPAVESSVVRLVPKRPRPQISFEEWDGMLRIAFIRKNRTLRASFLGTSTVVDLLEGNYRTWCAQNNIPLEEEPEHEKENQEVLMEDVQDQDLKPSAEAEWEGIMDVDDEPDFLGANPGKSKSNGRRRRRGKVTDLVKEKLRRVLEEQTGFADKRARQCDEGDFLRLLLAMNNEGIHFS